jgi:hypothetical protein
MSLNIGKAQLARSRQWAGRRGLISFGKYSGRQATRNYRNSIDFTVSSTTVNTPAASNSPARIAGANGAISVPDRASALRMSTSMTDESSSQRPGRDLQKCRRSRAT